MSTVKSSALEQNGFTPLQGNFDKNKMCSETSFN